MTGLGEIKTWVHTYTCDQLTEKEIWFFEIYPSQNFGLNADLKPGFILIQAINLQEKKPGFFTY